MAIWYFTEDHLIRGDICFTDHPVEKYFPQNDTSCSTFDGRPSNTLICGATQSAENRKATTFFVFPYMAATTFFPLNGSYYFFFPSATTFFPL